MNPINLNHIPIPRLRELFNESLKGSVIGIADSRLDIALNVPDSHFRLLHHILIAQYSKVTMHHRENPIPLVGLDIETNHTTGEPRLLGYSYADGYYQADDCPTLESLYFTVKGIVDNSERGTQLATWGNLDINCLIRLFDPDKDEQVFVSRGFGGRYRNGQWIARAPVIRLMRDGSQFCIDHYISGRSLRLCIVDPSSRQRTVWVYNISQFFPTRIAETAKALKYNWRDFASEHPEESNYSHLIDWERYREDSDYRQDVLASNKQDAQTVRMMGNHLQTIFYQAFGACPSLLVSTGSLADATVSKMLSIEDYESNSWQYLKYSTFGAHNETVQLAENLLSEAYSAGYVDQYAIGYHPVAHTADISSAYPHKIRQLPDLRKCRLIPGTGSFEKTVKHLKDSGLEIFTIVFRGLVTIPEHLEYHPITIKTASNQNIRPLGTFRAAYYLEERDFCTEHGATFKNEEWVIFALTERLEAPIARVSMQLATMRDEYREKLANAANEDESIFYDALQNMIRVVDNSLYGKNVMAVEIVEDINDKPVVTGLKAGDRFNKLYGGWITALTRTQIADACMSIQASGGSPLLAMTDAVYWTGEKNQLPSEMISYHGKVAGLFEPPETFEDFFLVKTGQYEYSKPSKKSPTGKTFYHKMRGLNLPYDDRSDSESFYRKTILEWLDGKSEYLHAEEVQIPVNTRKLVTVGMQNIAELGKVSDGVALMKPFVMSGKQVERFLPVREYRKSLNESVRLKPAVAKQGSDMDSPLEFLSGLNAQGGEYITRHERKRIFYLLIVKITGLSIRNRFRGKMPPEKQRLTDISWKELEEWSGIKREWAQL